MDPGKNNDREESEASKELSWVQVLLIHQLWLGHDHHMFPVPLEVFWRNKGSRPDELHKVIQGCLCS